MQTLPRPGYIYLLTFPDGQRYVGQTYRDGGVAVRVSRYRRLGTKSQWKLHAELVRQGADSFSVRVLAQGFQTLEGLNAAERYFIALFDTFHNGLNCTTGGDSGYVFSEAAKRRMSLSHTGKVLSREHRDAIGEGNRGKPKSEETRRKLSIANSGEKNPHFGKKQSAESNAKRRASMLGQRRGPEGCAVGGCSRRRIAKGLCGMHYHRQLRTGDAGQADPILNHTPSPPDGLCTVGGCGKPHRAKGMCAVHYSRKLRATRRALAG